MQTIWKWDIDTDVLPWDHMLVVPKGTEFLSAGMQNGQLVMWGLVDTSMSA